MEKLKTGDVVQLNSGGPNMTVTHYRRRRNYAKPDEWIYHDTIVICTWFEGTTQVSGEFDHNTLHLIKS